MVLAAVAAVLVNSGLHAVPDDADALTGLVEGDRVGRFLVLLDVEGQRHAVSAGAITAMCDTSSGTVLLLGGGKMVCVDRSMETLLAWLDGRKA